MIGQSNRAPAHALIADSPAIAELVNELCQELGDSFPQALVREMIHDVASGYRDAKITAYVPIFVCREAKERLARMALLSDARESEQVVETNILYGVVRPREAGSMQRGVKALHPLLNGQNQAPEPCQAR